MKSGWQVLVAVLAFTLLLAPAVSATVTQTSWQDGYYTLVQFSGNGTTTWTAPYGVTDISYLMVAGGGSGGSYYGGGGGAGGYLTGTGLVIDPGSSYTITVGTGGEAVKNNHGIDGTNSTITNGTLFISAKGGGYGGNGGAPDGGAGGSGGGAGGLAIIAEYPGGANVSGQGYPGGYHTEAAGASGSGYPSGGGGGAGTVGRNATGTYAMQGGSGVWTNLVHSAGDMFAGGGGGCSEYVGGSTYAGLGGAGATGANNATAGIDGTGTGGGGTNSALYYSGKGGNGIVVLKYQTYPTAWTYTTPGTYYWVCPDYVHNIYLTLVGAGGSGKGAFNSGGYKIGYGGSAGEHGSYSNVNVTPGTNYTIVVGTGGLISVADTPSNNGTLSSFTTAGWTGYTKAGGAGGLSTPLAALTNGGNGAAGFINTTKYAVDGGNSGEYTGGTAGLGYGAGGGGGAASAVSGGSGGAGAGGYIKLNMIETSEGNSPDFSASTTVASVGNLIEFTDTSVIRNNLNMTYLWNFGDGYTSTTVGTVNHVYGLYGVYTVNLTITSDSGEVTTEKSNYITISQSQSTTFQVPRTVTFDFTDKRGTPLPGVYVTATPINFTMPESWLQTYYGINSGVSLSGTTLSGYTSSDGGWAAPMSASVQYRMTFSGTGVVDQNITLYPKDSDYLFQLLTPGDYVQPTPASNYINYVMGNATIDSTHEHFNLSYHDTSGGTSQVSMTVRNSTGAIVYSGTRSGFGTAETTINSGPIIHSPGDSYTYTMSAKQNQLGYVNRTYTITWENLKTLSNYPDWVAQWLGIGLLVILAGVFSIISIKFALVIIPVVTYFMTFYMRWLQPEIGVSTFIGCLSVLFVLGVLRYMRESKKKLAG